VELTRREFVKVLAAAGAVAALPAAAEARAELRAETVTFHVPDLDPAHDGLRVAQLSDLHVGERTPPACIRQAIQAANHFQPDLVVLTGDYLCRKRSGLALMREQLGGLEAPTVAVLGNHDHWVDARGAMRALEGHGYAVLQNRNTTLRLRGAPLTVVGVDDLLTGHSRPREALAGAAAGSSLVLAHGPRTADQLRRLARPLLCLSGHTHGGQINIPGLTPLALRVLAREPYQRGRYQLGMVQLYVNRGVGNSGFRLRLNADPEVTLATLRRAVA